MEVSSTIRIKFILAGFLVAGLIIFIRLFTWQIVKYDVFASAAQNQHQTSTVIQAKRGSIFASDGFSLASSKEAWLVWASLPSIKEPDTLARKIAEVIVEEPADKKLSLSLKSLDDLIEEETIQLTRNLNRTDVSWVPLAKKVSKEKKEQIQSFNFSGIGFDLEEDRNYPEGSMGAHVLGFVGRDSADESKGYFGLEGYYDLTLSGLGGVKDWEKDALGVPILAGISRKLTASDGLSLKTHFDRTVQYTIEEHLTSGLEKYGALAGSVVVMRPQDGAILGLASSPSFDPSRYSSFSRESYVNPVVSSTFEPGSIFKVIVMAAALDNKAVTPELRCEMCSGPRKVAEYTIRTWDDKYYPDSTAQEIIQHSDNVGMIWIAEKLGSKNFYDYLSKFGFGEKTGVDLQGETRSFLKPLESWTAVDLATASFGQGIAVSPIQMVKAVGAVANDGKIVTPQVVDKIQGEGLEKDIEPQLGGQVISKRAAREITEMMISAVRAGEAKWAAPKGFRIAGKTGTAQIPVSGHYDEEKTIASFIGFAPANQPKFVMLVTLREPQSSPWASETAAPLWFSIAKELFPYFKIYPER